MLPRTRWYGELLSYARRVSRRADEAEDLVQIVLLAAHERGRLDISAIDNRRWMMGALRRRAAFDARSALRRRRREAALASDGPPAPDAEPGPTQFVESLPAALRTTALLALSGHTRAEIAFLLRLSDAALRQRIADIRRRWRGTGGAGGTAVTELPGLRGTLAYGRIRRALLGPMRNASGALGSHDPDGHIFIVRPNSGSQNGSPRQQDVVDSTSKAQNHVRQDQDR